jgi:hypothetical protein
VHDLAIKEGDLIAATHGRSFYILDDLSPLRQMNATTLAKDAQLYKPRDTYRIDWGGGRGGGGGGASVAPPTGVQVYYTLKQAGQVVSLDFVDAAGKVIKSFSSNADSASVAAGAGRGGRGAGAEDAPPEEGGGRGRGNAPPRMANHAGLNAFAWNMRYADAVTFPGMILWSGDTRGPIAPQGTYSVRLRVGGGAPQSQTFRLLNDPRSKAMAADQLAQFNFLIKLRDRITEANEAVISMRFVKNEIDDRLKRAPAAASQELSAAGAPIKTNLSGVEAEVYQVKNQSSQDPLNFPIKLNNKLASLNGVVSSAPGAPTAQAVQVFDELSTKLGVQTGKMHTLYTRDLAKFNELLKKYGLPLIDTTPKPKVAM